MKSVHYELQGYYYNKMAFIAHYVDSDERGVLLLPCFGVGLYCETWLERNFGIGHTIPEMMEIAKAQAKEDLDKNVAEYEKDKSVRR